MDFGGPGWDEETSLEVSVEVQVRSEWRLGLGW